MRTRPRTAVLVAGSAVALLSGCSALGISAAEDGGAQVSTGKGSTNSWVLVSQGARRPSAAPGGGATPSATPLLTLRPTTTGAMPSAMGTPACAGNEQLGGIAGLAVKPGAGSATVTWYNPGDPRLVQYRLTAIPQNLVGGSQPDLTWQEIAPGAGCRTMTATVTGLTSGAPYVFSLDAVLTNYDTDGNRTATIARSLVVYSG
jgi:hypothetical protein